MVCCCLDKWQVRELLTQAGRKTNLGYLLLDFGTINGSCWSICSVHFNIVKLQPKPRLGVDFVFPLSQEQEEEEELPHQNFNEGEVLEV